VKPTCRVSLVALAALFCARAEAHPRNEVPLRRLPAWALEAMALPLPSTQAPAVVAFEELEVQPVVASGVRETRRRAVRVVSPAGLKREGEDVLQYQADDQVLSYRVWTVSPEEVARAIDDKDDVDDVPAIPGFSGYSDVRLRVARVPGLEVSGWKISESVVVRALDLGADAHLFGDVDVPTVLSRVVLRTPPGWSRAWTARRAPGLVPEISAETASFTLRDLSPLVLEPLGPPVRDLLPVVWLRWGSPDGKRGFAGWADVARWAADLSEPALTEMGGVAARASALRPADPAGLIPALRRAFEHAARDVRYVSIQLGIGGYRPEAPARVETSLYGDCKAKATLLRALLQSWGLRTYSVIVATHSWGEVDPEVPTPAQFNHMIAAVALPAEMAPAPWPTLDVPEVGRLLFLDPTGSQGDAWDLGDEVQGTLALLVHPQAPQLVRLPLQPAATACESRTLRGRLDETGELLEAEVDTRYVGTRAANWRWQFAGTSEQQRREVMAREIQRTIPGTAVTAYRVEGTESFETAVHELLDLRGGRVGRRAGDLLVVEPGRLAARALDPLPATPRRWPLHLGAPRRYEVEVALHAPAGRTPEDLPPAASLRTAFLEGHAAWSFEEGCLVYRRQVELAGGTLAPEDYPAFREALRTVQGWDAAGIVLAVADQRASATSTPKSTQR